MSDEINWPLMMTIFAVLIFVNFVIGLICKSQMERDRRKIIEESGRTYPHSVLIKGKKK